MKKKNIAIIDTETAGGFGKLKIYDFGVVIMTQKGEIVAEYESLVKEVFVPKHMATAYYSNKIECYYSMLMDTLRIRPWDTIRDDVNTLFDKHDVGIVSAYNLAFDTRAIKATTKLYSKHDSFLTTAKDTLDLWLWSCQSLLSKKKYHKYATKHNMITPAGNVKTSAEVSYSYLHNLPNFIESHTALDDCYIEADIAKTLLKRRVKKPLNEPFGMPWRLAQAKA
jgi:hypothetical protein